MVSDFNHRNVNWDLMASSNEVEKFLKVIQDIFFKTALRTSDRGIIFEI